MGHQHQGDAALVQGVENGQHLRGGAGIEGAGGFIGQQQRRVVDDRPGDGHPLLLAAGELIWSVGQTLGQAHPLQGRGRPPTPLHQGHARINHRQHHVLQGTELGQQVKLLKHKAQVAVAQ